jgi:hypothetical protein
MDCPRERVIAIVIVVAVVATGFSYNFSQVKLNSSNIQMIIGPMTRDEFLDTRVRSKRCFDYIEQVTVENETILMLHENKGYYLDRPYLADGMYETSYFVNKAAEIGDAGLFADWIQKQNIRFVLINQNIREGNLTKARKPGFFKDEKLNDHYLGGLEILEEFIEQHLQLEFSHYGSNVYRLGEILEKKRETEIRKP